MNFIITTTDNIEGGTIKRYIDTVCANVVIGTNVFSDVAASFTDFFGGRSESYQRKLELIYNEAKKVLRNKAQAIGANAVIGLKVDFDEISGKNKSMFMVSVCGTACSIDYEAGQYSEITGGQAIQQEDLNREINKRYITEQINEGAAIKTPWIEFLMENPLIEVVGNLIDRYIHYYGKEDYEEKSNFIISFLSLFPKGEIDGMVYDKYINNKDAVHTIIRECRLFNPALVLSACKQDVHFGIRLLDTERDYYQKEDMVYMLQLYDYLDNLPDTGRIEVVKGKMFGKEQKKFICEHGHKSSPDSEYCEDFNCGINIKGLTKAEVAAIDGLKEKIDILKKLLGE